MSCGIKVTIPRVAHGYAPSSEDAWAFLPTIDALTRCAYLSSD